MQGYDRIEMVVPVRNENSYIFAVHTSDGPAIYYDLEDALNDLRANEVRIRRGDFKFYRKHRWRRLPSRLYRRAYANEL